MMKKFFISSRPFKFLLCVLVFLSLLFIVHDAYVQPPPPPTPTYTISAHGNTSYGVNRTGLNTPINFGYSTGNCAHCHEQHASIGGTEPAPAAGSPSKYLLFTGIGQDQDSRFCYNCHRDPGASVQYPSGSMPNQYNYSYMAGGDTTLTCPDNIRDAFLYIDSACSPKTSWCSHGGLEASAHCLYGIQDLLKNKWNFPARDDVQACSGCHNPHRTKRDPHTTTGRTDALGNLIVSSVSLPSKHSKDNNVWDLWGDQSGERMRDYALTNGALYCAPYRASAGAPNTARREPDGCSALANACQPLPAGGVATNCTNGSGMFDAVTFCLECHAQSVGGQTAINWTATGDVHGLAPSQNCCDLGDKIAPYPDDSQYTPANPYPNHVVSCLDCHEPHGSPNDDLLREVINGTRLPTYVKTDLRWWDLCSACHTIKLGTMYHLATMGPTDTCTCHSHSTTRSVQSFCTLPGCPPPGNPIKSF